MMRALLLVSTRSHLKDARLTFVREEALQANAADGIQDIQIVKYITVFHAKPIPRAICDIWISFYINSQATFVRQILFCDAKT